MVTSRDLVTGGKTCAKWFTKMLSSRESLLLFFGIPYGNSVKLMIFSANFEVDSSLFFEAHLFSTYLKYREQVNLI